MTTVTFQAVFRFILVSYSLRYKLPTHYSTLLRFLAGVGVREAGGRAYWVWGSGEGWTFAWNICVTRPTVLTEAARIHYTKHNAVAALVTRP